MLGQLTAQGQPLQGCPAGCPGTRASLETHAQGQGTGRGNLEIAHDVSPLISVGPEKPDTLM